MAKQQNKPLYHISFWPIWVLMAVMRLLVNLPHHWLMALGKGIGWLMYQLPFRRRRIAATNIAICFPELSETEAKERLKRTMQANITGILEAVISWLKPGKIADLELVNVELLDQLIAKENGVLLIGAHYTTLDIAGRLLGATHPINAIYRPQNNPVINWVMERGRKQYMEAPVINQHDIRGMIRCLKGGSVLWFPADQDHGIKSGVFAPLYGQQAATLTMPTRLVKVSGAALVFCSYFRKPDNSYIMYFSEVDGFTGKDELKDATLLNQALEASLLEYPEQYMWVHRRFKTRPKGETSLYQ